MNTQRLKKLQIGTLFLKVFYGSLFLDIVLLLYFVFSRTFPWQLVLSIGLIEFFIFWIGILLVYLHSEQLGIKPRLLGILFGFVPIANLIMLNKIIGICNREIQLEKERNAREIRRRDYLVCATRYPILLVHGVFFRDYKHLNYWGRIPKDLAKNGARIYYGNHNSAASVEDSAKELQRRVDQILEKTSFEKINIIAHSKGGLDARVLIANGYGDKIASLTTINTPHRGCEFADYFLEKIPKEIQEKIAAKYNAAARKLGDTYSDFIAAVNDLTASACKKRNEEIKDDSRVFYQSVGSVLQKATSGRFPLNLTYNIVKIFDGENDGLVGTESFPWGEKYTLLRNEKKARGISHADMIDLNRENIDGFDVREFYIQLVSDLKKRGY